MKYILNTNKQDSDSGNNYEVHNLNNCEHLPLEQNREYLGEFTGCISALNSAKTIYPRAAQWIDGCYYCCPSCHTG